MDHFSPCDGALLPGTEPVDDPVPATDVTGADHERDGAGPEPLELAALRRVMATQPVIEQAKGMLMGCYGTDADSAFAILSRWSSRRHLKVRELAQELVAAAAVPDPVRFGSLRRYLEEHLEGSSPS